MKDVMIDIETMSCGSNPVITQIAACYFNRFTGELIYGHDGGVFMMNIDITDSLRKGFVIDGDTLKWWLQRTPTFLEDAKPLDDVLRCFYVFLGRATSVWSHSSFDAPKLANLFERCGRTLPWNKRVLRDLRTLYYLADYDRVPSDQREADDDGVHDGLSDCVYQCKEVAECFKLLATRTFMGKSNYRDG